MKPRFFLFTFPILLLTSLTLSAQARIPPQYGDAPFTEAPSDVAFWVAYWEKPPVDLFGPAQEAFIQNVQPIMFPLNVYDHPLNPDILDADAQWLKDHASDHFYIDGYASSDGELGYNLELSMRRAEWVKQALISRGIADNRIVLAAPWGQLYPTCAEQDETCWSKNRLVRFVYAAH